MPRNCASAVYCSRPASARIPAARAVGLELVPAQERAHPAGAERAHRLGGLGRVADGLIPTSAAGRATGEAAIAGGGNRDHDGGECAAAKHVDADTIGRRRRVLKCTLSDGSADGAWAPSGRAQAGREHARRRSSRRRSSSSATSAFVGVQVRARARTPPIASLTRSVRASAWA